MHIDFNHVRSKAGESYNRLVEFLISKNNDGIIKFDDEEVEDIINDLRISIGTIMNTYEAGDEGFKSLYNEPFLLVFNTYFDGLFDESETHAE